MTTQGDPYRTLGIGAGASLNEIRSAYRRLAKQYHPDAAGERALPRFLAIQAAYEMLVDGEGRLRPPGWWTATGARRGTAATPGTGAPADPWRADANRARASRDAWRARRAGGGTTSSRTGGAAGASARGSGTGAGGAGTGAGGTTSRPPGERQHHARRGPRKATPGSTSYDEAAEPLDPSWEGGAWYGQNSGTYWTINPREYADPRKHGPEYLARARRAAGADDDPDPSAARRPAGGPAASDPTPGAAPDADAEGESGEWAWTGADESTTTGGGARWGTRSWRFEARDAGAAGPDWTPGVEGRDRERERARAWASAAAAGRATSPTEDVPPLPDIESLARQALPEHLLELARRDLRWRLVLALVAWPPIGYAIGGTVSAATGCATFTASCPEPVPVLVLLVQPLIIAALFALPVATAVAAFASLAALAASIPFGAVLSVGALPKPVIEPTILAVVVIATYAVALGAGAVRLWRRPRAPDATP